MKQKILKLLYRYLAFCTRYYLSRTNIKIVAITGSVGKTSCRMVVSEVLQQVQKTNSWEQFRIYTSPKNYNSELGLVFSVFQIEDYHPSFKNLLQISLILTKRALISRKKYDILIAEYGIDAPEDMDHLLSIARPDIAVLTKLDSVHSANFPQGVEEYWQEKWKLLLVAKSKVYINLQDHFSRKNIHLLSKYTEIFEENNVLKAELKKHETDIARWYFLYKEKNISLNLLGEENIVYAKLGLDIAGDFGISLWEINYDFDLELQAGRFTLFQQAEHIFIDSSYNAAPESMKQVLYNTKMLQNRLFIEYKMIAVLWDMRELDNVQHTHEALARELWSFERVFTVGPSMYEYMTPKLKELGFSGSITSSLSSRDIGQKLKKFLEETSQKYIIIFKGSQNTIFTEEALAVFLTSVEQKKLPRQSEAWRVKKEEFFRTV